MWLRIACEPEPISDNALGVASPAAKLQSIAFPLFTSKRELCRYQCPAGEGIRARVRQLSRGLLDDQTLGLLVGQVQGADGFGGCGSDVQALAGERGLLQRVNLRLLQAIAPVLRAGRQALEKTDLRL